MDILGHYLFLSICGYLTSFLCLVLGFLVLHANPRSQSCRLAFLFNVSVALWSGFYATMYHAKSQAFGVFVSQMLTFGTVNLCAFFTHLVLTVVNKAHKQKKILIANYSIGCVLNVVIFSTPLMIHSVSSRLGLVYTDGGPLYVLIPVYLFSNVIFSVYQITSGIRTFRGYKRNQLVLFLSAALIGFICGTPAFFMVLNIPIKPVTTPLVSLYPIILTYAIVKHRFLDIRKLVKNTLIFSLLFILLLAFTFIALYLLNEVILRKLGIPESFSRGLVIACAMALYAPLKTGLSRVTNNILFQHSKNPETIFQRLSNNIFHYLETQKLLDEVVRRIADILALDRIGFYLRIQQSPYSFELVSHIGRLRKNQFNESRQLIRYLEKIREPLVSPHTQRESRAQKPIQALDTAKTVKQEAAVELARLGGVAAFPVFVQKELRGILVLGRKKSDAPWQEEEFEILKSFMRYLSLALANAQYAEEIRKSRERISKCERDASAGALIAGIEHEVKNPLSAMMLNLSALTESLQDKTFTESPREVMKKSVSEIMELLLQNVGKIDQIISHLSNLAESKPLTIQEGILPFGIADKAIQAVNCDPEKIRIKNEIPRTLAIDCDPDALLEILVNLIRNAGHAIPGQGEIILEGGHVHNEKIIRVKDTGSGISKTQLEKIFEPFYTTKRRKSADGITGSGMGLFIVKQFMEAMGGRITVESEPGKGSAFILRFPGLESAFGRAAA